MLRLAAIALVVSTLSCSGREIPVSSPEAVSAPAVSAQAGSSDFPTIDLEALEYEASYARGRLQAPNRAHNLRAYFDPAGVSVHTRVGDTGAPLFTARLQRIGRGDLSTLVPAGDVLANGARVEIKRTGSVEWFVNRPSGLEHGVTLEGEPRGSGDIWVEIGFDGARVEASDDGLEVVSEAGRRIHYSSLVVLDATGAQLPASARVDDDGRAVRLIAAADGAQYPITFDPVFGSAVTNVPDSSILAPFSYITPPTTTPENRLGYVVAGAGDVNGDGRSDYIVASPTFDHGQQDEGLVLLMGGGPSGGYSTLESDQAGIGFGASAAAAGDVNADGFDDIVVRANIFSGFAAFVFHGSASGIPNGTIANAATQIGSSQQPMPFGSAVSGAGDFDGDGYDDVLLGGWSFSGDQTQEGAAFLFRGGPAGVVSGGPLNAAYRFESDQTGSFMGVSVASAGDVNSDGKDDILVGAMMYDSGSNDEGAAFLFHGASGGPAVRGPSHAASTFQGNQAAAYFGANVAGVGDVNGDGWLDVAVAAIGFDAGEENEGAIFVLHGNAGGPSSAGTEGAHGRVEGGQVGLGLGSALSRAGDMDGDGFDDLVVGAPQWDIPQAVNVGAVAVFRGGESGIGVGAVAAADWLYAAPFNGTTVPSNANYGYSVAGVGDLNPDGYSDIVAGVPGRVTGGCSQVPPGTCQAVGGALVFVGGNRRLPIGTTGTASTRILSSEPYGYLGRGIDAGDFNGDGRDDFVTTTSAYVDWLSSGGALLIFYGAEGGIPSGSQGLAATVLRAPPPLSGRTLGDVNGDGADDLLAYPQDGDGYLILGGPSGIPSSLPPIIPLAYDAVVPRSLAPVGDVNGDGFGDVGTYVAGTVIEGTYTGAACQIFHGGSSGLIPWELQTPSTNIQLSGHGKCGLGGDFNGDGFDDMLSYSGSGVRVFYGSTAGIPSGVEASAGTTISNWSPGPGSDLEEAWTHSVGDLNDDGYDDLAILIEGRVQLILGTPSGLPTGGQELVSWTFGGGFVALHAGRGDVSGDGIDDLIVGNPTYSLPGPPPLASVGGIWIVEGAERFESVSPARHVGISAHPQIAGDQPPPGTVVQMIGSPTYGPAVSADFDGNGINDVGVGATHYNNPATPAMGDGGLFVFQGAD